MESDLELESLTRSVSVRMRLSRSYRAAWLPAIKERHLHFSQQSQYAVGDVFFSLYRTAPDFYFHNNFGMHSNSAGSQFSIPLKAFQRQVFQATKCTRTDDQTHNKKICHWTRSI